MKTKTAKIPEVSEQMLEALLQADSLLRSGFILVKTEVQARQIRYTQETVWKAIIAARQSGIKEDESI